MQNMVYKFYALMLNFNVRALRILGIKNYILYLFLSLIHLPEIIRAGNLSPLDKIMGLKEYLIHYKGSKFFFDCFFCDERSGVHNSFSLIRELYIRDCYFRFHERETFLDSKIVLDIGANCGDFSIMMASHAQKVICIEVQPIFIDLINHNMNINHFDNYSIESTFVGGKGSYKGNIQSKSTIIEILDRNNLVNVDFIKLDIEGSEFELFETPEWLERTKYLSMEVHPIFGDPQMILNVLERNGFRYTAVDHYFKPAKKSRDIFYIYARKCE